MDGERYHPEIDPSTDILAKLVRAIHNRLLSEGSTLVAYDIGLFDGAQLFTTHHLRRTFHL